MTNEFQSAASRETGGGTPSISEQDGERSNGLRPRARRVFVRTVRDALVAFTAFGFISGAVVCLPSAASPTLAGAAFSVPAPNGSAVSRDARDDRAPVVQIATTVSSTSSNAVFRRTSDQTAYLLLAVAFSLLAALNLAFVRHLREAYAPLLRRSKLPQKGSKS